MNRNQRGFTLIELLVTVLIIAILSAVALPQYNKAVRKTRGTEVLASVNILDKALAAYYLEHGSYKGVGADTLGIDMPELKTFQYAVGTGCNLDARSNNFVGNALTLSDTYAVDWCADQVRLHSTWEKGKQTSLVCTGELCSSYFTCAETHTIIDNTGCIPHIVGTECYLN